MFVGINFKSLFKMEKIRLLTVGTVGAIGTEIIQNAPALDPNEITSIGNLVIQIVIGVFTLFGMFKRKKK